MQTKRRRARSSSKPKSSRPAKKQLSAVSIQNLRTLAEEIGRVIPGTSPNPKGFCFQTIAKKSGLFKFWPRHGAKKELIFGFLKEVYRRHPKTFYRIFREN